MMHYYVGAEKGTHRYRVFWTEVNPTEKTHGSWYSYVIGPFRTKRGATFMAKYGNGNPHCQSVADAERLARRKNPDDPIVRKTAQGYEVSDIIDGYRVHKQYIGYTKKQAVALFKKEHYTRANPSLKRYLVTLNADQGRFVLEVVASSKEAAMKMIMKAEGCPVNAIRSIILSPKRRN